MEATETIQTNPTENNLQSSNKNIIFVVIIVSVLVIAGVVGAILYLPSMNTNQGTNTLNNIGKAISENNYTEALKYFDLDAIAQNFIDGDDLWIQALQSQGVASPTADEISSFRKQIVDNAELLDTVKKGIIKSLRDAVQGDEGVNPNHKLFLDELVSGKIPETKADNGDISFPVGNGLEVWHMKNYDGIYKIYKITFITDTANASSSTTTESTSSTTESSSASTSSLSSSSESTSSAAQ
jgi:flagellar basal body-associated protein FliL